jgi:hypothetical protein
LPSSVGSSAVRSKLSCPERRGAIAATLDEDLRASFLERPDVRAVLG